MNLSISDFLLLLKVSERWRTNQKLAHRLSRKLMELQEEELRSVKFEIILNLNACITISINVFVIKL